MQCSMVDGLRIFVPGVFVLPRAFALYIYGTKLGGCQYKGPFEEGSLTFILQFHLYLKLKQGNPALIFALSICIPFPP